jgi:flagellin
MSFRINTNIAAMNAHTSGVINNRNLDTSLARLSSGLRINTAADDASGMAIADSLRSQANSLGQAIKNANDAIGVIQTADKAMDEQIKIVDTIKTKAVQAAMDGQSTQSRQALQSDIVRLMEELDNIATTTSFNGMKLLSGSFTNKEFQIGAYSNETVKASISATNSSKIGAIRYETSATISATAVATLKFVNPNGTVTTLQPVTISTSAGTGIGALADAINRASDMLGVRASYRVVTTGSAAVQAGTISNLRINGVTIGDVINIKSSDSNGNLVNSINAVTQETGVYASVDVMGRLVMTSSDGRGIDIKTGSAGAAAGVTYNAAYTTMGTTSASATVAGGPTINDNFGRLTLVSLSARDIIISAGSVTGANGSIAKAIYSGSAANMSLDSVRSNFSVGDGLAAGAYANKAESGAASASKYMGAGVTTKTGAMIVMDLADSARTMLDRIRSDLGSAQNQLTSTINNISVTQVSVSAAESQIRDVDFAEESATFSKNNILVQSGSFAMAQANQVQQNVLKLLQ